LDPAVELRGLDLSKVFDDNPVCEEFNQLRLINSYLKAYDDLAIVYLRYFREDIIRRIANENEWCVHDVTRVLRHQRTID